MLFQRANEDEHKMLAVEKLTELVQTLLQGTDLIRLVLKKHTYINRYI